MLANRRSQREGRLKPKNLFKDYRTVEKATEQSQYRFFAVGDGISFFYQIPQTKDSQVELKNN